MDVHIQVDKILKEHKDYVKLAVVYYSGLVELEYDKIKIRREDFHKWSPAKHEKPENKQ